MWDIDEQQYAQMQLHHEQSLDIHVHNPQ